MVASPQSPPVDRRAPEPDRVVRLSGATWADYQRLLEIRGEQSCPRIAFARGEIEMMVPSRDHERIKSFLGCLVEAWCLERGVEFTPVGSWTLESKAAEGGAEPDECYVFGEEAVDRPHLVIEVVWTAGRLDKLDIYRRLGVPEVWWWQDDTLKAFALRGERYEEIAGSEVLAGIDRAMIVELVLEHETVSAAIRALRQRLADG